ncbi:MAG TPA: aldose 1-epimerase [Rectinemataceae bacterium]|nr:aldose 1-epimerase [Rectinemataceae bacterium]
MSGAAAIEKTSVNGIPAIRLSAGGYAASICPSMGANCFQLERGGASFLRTPPSLGVFRENPNVYGLPLLFPPNRVGGGKYLFQGREYRLPVNEIGRGNHIHGFLSSAEFSLLGTETGSAAPGGVVAAGYGDAGREGRDSCGATFTYEATREAPYSSFSHEFRVILGYSLSGGGLVQRLEVENRGDSDMPIGLGFHAAFNCPFLPGTSPDEYLLRLSVSEELLLDGSTFIPTGEVARASRLVSALRGEGARPQGGAISSHFRGERGRPGRAVLSHVPSGRSIAYETDPLFAFWMVWNQGGDKGFICPEPQTWMVDAPNSALPPEESGFRALRPGASIVLRSTLSEIDNQRR